jgi:hypothetical protein
MSYSFKGISINTIISPGNVNPGGNSYIGFPPTNTYTYGIEKPKSLLYAINTTDLSNTSKAISYKYNNNYNTVQSYYAPNPQSVYPVTIPNGAKYMSVICVGGGGGGGHGGRGYYNGFNGTAKGGNGGAGGNGNYTSIDNVPLTNIQPTITIYSGGLGPLGINDNDDGQPGSASKVTVTDNVSGPVNLCLAPAGNGGIGGNDGSQNGNSNGNNGASGTSPTGSFSNLYSPTANGITSYYGGNNFYPPPDAGFGIGGIGGNGGNKSGGNQGTSGTNGYVTIYYYFD